MSDDIERSDGHMSWVPYSNIQWVARQVQRISDDRTLTDFLNAAAVIQVVQCKSWLYKHQWGLVMSHVYWYSGP